MARWDRPLRKVFNVSPSLSSSQTIRGRRPNIFRKLSMGTSSCREKRYRKRDRDKEQMSKNEKKT
jgi:hypothetical protein